MPPLDESLDFNPEPQTQAEYVRDIWRRVAALEAHVAKQNGRVGKLERFQWILVGVGGSIATVLIVLNLLQLIHVPGL